MSISLEMDVPQPGQYPATVLAIRLFERGVRVFAKVSYQLDSEPPFDVTEFVHIREERDGTDTLRGRARLRALAAAARVELKAIASDTDLQALVGTKVAVTINLQEDEGIQIPKVVSVTDLAADDGGPHL